MTAALGIQLCMVRTVEQEFLVAIDPKASGQLAGGLPLPPGASPSAVAVTACVATRSGSAAAAWGRRSLASAPCCRESSCSNR